MKKAFLSLKTYYSSIFALSTQEFIYHCLHHSPMATKGFMEKNVVFRKLWVKPENKVLFIFPDAFSLQNFYG